jgi:23S rRNA (cytidine1920-2'-O)/16S rRNA (cytidine1409-2'-O)-methyltransferase
MRIDQYLTQHFPYSRSRIHLLIADGSVTLGDKVFTKPSQNIDESTDPSLINISDSIRYVSRAGLKLYHALLTWGIYPAGMTCLDIGSSTGGFTDCLLQHDTTGVDCVDVGTNQLHEKLRSDSRVSVYEQTDIRNFTSDDQYDLIVCDVSFISLAHIITQLPRFAKNNSRCVLLIKPQFELGKEFLDKQGIVRDNEKINQLVTEISTFLSQNHYTDIQYIDSPISGGDGNREVLITGVYQR